jgi:type II secretory pathway component PulJ
MAAVQKIQEAAVQSKLKDTGRMWLWAFLAVIALAQFYVVRELLAALALFALGFAALAAVIASLYALQKTWELAVQRLAALRQPVMSMAKVTNMASVARLASADPGNPKAA